MKVLLINPPDERIPLGRPTWTPLSQAYAAGVLRRAGCAVRVFDRQAHHHRASGSAAEVDRAMLSAVEEFQPDLVLLEAQPLSIYDTCRSARRIRRAHGGALGVFGPQATALPALCFEKIPQIDLLVEGEAEGPLAALAAGDSAPPGVWRRGGGRAEPPSQPAGRVDMDWLPWPALDLLDLDYYARRSTYTIWCHHLSSLTLMTSRGCRNQCAFCLESRSFGAGLRFRSLEKVLEDVQRTLRERKLGGIYFRDCDFVADPRRCREFCEMMIKAGLHRRIVWAAQARADGLDRELAALMKRAGCTLLEFGVETPVARHLAALNKTAAPEAAGKALAACRAAGIFSHAYLMTGLPGETRADLAAAEDWVRRHRPSSFFWVHLQVLPGTPLYQTRGDSFFERNPWDDREAVLAYFRRDLSELSQAERAGWLKNRARPLARRSRRLCQLRANPPRALAGLLGERLSRPWRGGGPNTGGEADV